MAKRLRDYKAEERRRNERAKAAGFTSRAQMRGKLRRGEAVVGRDRAGRIVPAVAQGPTRPEWAKAGYSSERMYKAERDASRLWSKRHSHKPTSKFLPRFTPEQSSAYYDAYVNPDTRAAKIVNELESLRHYLVDVMGFYTQEEFDDLPY